MMQISEADMGPDAAYLARCRKRMEQIDAQPPEIRALVHEFGWSVVNSFLMLKITKASHIRHLIEVVREGSASYSNGTCGRTMRDAELRDMVRRHPVYAVSRREPTEAMIQASMAEVTPALGPLTKHEKHRRRLKVALAVGHAEFLGEGAQS